MGGDRIDPLNSLLDKIFIALEEDQNLEELFEELFKIDIASLSSTQQRYLLNALNQIEKKICQKKEQTIERLTELEKLRKFRY